MGTLMDMRMDVLEAALVQNPTVGYFPWNVTDYPLGTYPQGVPRFAVVNAFKNHAAICKTNMTLGTQTYPFNNQSYGNTAAGSTAPVNNAGAIVRAEDVV